MIKSDVTYEDGNYGTLAVVRSEWNKRIEEDILRKGCTEIEFNSAKGWRGDELPPLDALSDLLGIEILGFNIKSIDSVHVLKQLRSLGISTYCNTPIQFENFPDLEICSLEWRKKSDSLFKCKNLKDIFINKYPYDDLKPLQLLTKLERLALLNSKLKSLDGIENIKNIRRLRIANLRGLTSLDGIENLSKLENLDIDTCRKITHINQLENLENLKEVFINNCNEIESLKPLRYLKKLEKVAFVESTNIVDGDLSPLMDRKPPLTTVAFMERKHYSHNREDFKSN
ncbi:leucine-rich repeat domain-containing protein [Xenorhabdus cabanillasii]|uniref:R13L1/DRL21-like LRR repeat region domain-containing protein n=1 Tax=Xenorhabdus cabanillasii JM26 TaxID=1427517 RepID=W1J9C2_9GAMM|nr:leucine-rich repeat domain-containing protein [Xenorhabdus cabanillasii]PHM76725.1 putative internalin A [Xenorhabdus cabanillasii JM26]CDL86090.1 hypothetical protein XCR1_2730002 [Xenorhabdus cabanillasii JM26]